MGVDYTAILAIGKEFDNDGAGEIVDFLVGHNILSGDDLGLLETEGDSYIQEILYDREDGLECSCLNLYSGYGYYLGFGVSCQSPELFEKTFKEGMRMWQEMFPDVPAEIINTVRVS